MKLKYEPITFRDAYLHEHRTSGMRTCPVTYRSKKDYDKKSVRKADRKVFKKYM